MSSKIAGYALVFSSVAISSAVMGLTVVYIDIDMKKKT